MPQLPFSLKVVAGLSFVGGIAALLSLLGGMSTGHLSINPMLLGLFAGPGLLRLSRGWRTCWLVLLWFTMIGLALTVPVVLFGAGSIDVSFMGMSLGRTSGTAALALAAAGSLVAWWEYRVLTRPDVRWLFGLRDGNDRFGRLEPPPSPPPMSKRSRRLWMAFFVVLAVVVCGVQVQRYRWWQRSISSVGGGSGLGAPGGYYDNFQTTFYGDHRDRPVATVFFVYDVLDGSIPKMTRSYRYDSREGGVLKIDGELVSHIDEDRISPLAGSKLFVNGPYGHTVEFELTDKETEELLPRLQTRQWQDTLKFWRDEVEPRLYRLEGATVEGKRDGTWTYYLGDDHKYQEVEYKLGQRHGTWRMFYPNGQAMSERQFEDGEVVGEWKYYSESGAPVGEIPWSEASQMTGGGGSGGGMYMERRGAWRWAVSETNGGSFSVKGRTIEGASRKEVEEFLAARPWSAK